MRRRQLCRCCDFPLFLPLLVGQTEADAYMDLMDGFTAESETAPDGFITMDEWLEFFNMIATDDTGKAETSPESAKALAALEYAQINYYKKPAMVAVATTNFWMRVTALFQRVERESGQAQTNGFLGPNKVPKTVLINYFRGKTAEADWCVGGVLLSDLSVLVSTLVFMSYGNHIAFAGIFNLLLAPKSNGQEWSRSSQPTTNCPWRSGMIFSVSWRKKIRQTHTHHRPHVKPWWR